MGKGEKGYMDWSGRHWVARSWFHTIHGIAWQRTASHQHQNWSWTWLPFYSHIVVFWIPHGGQDSVGRRAHVVTNLDVELCKIWNGRLKCFICTQDDDPHSSRRVITNYHCHGREDSSVWISLPLWAFEANNFTGELVQTRYHRCESVSISAWLWEKRKRGDEQAKYRVSAAIHTCWSMWKGLRSRTLIPTSHKSSEENKQLEIRVD